MDGWTPTSTDTGLRTTRTGSPRSSGNHRLDTLRNVVADPRVGLLFLVPGLGEELRGFTTDAEVAAYDAARDERQDATLY